MIARVGVQAAQEAADELLDAERPAEEKGQLQGLVREVIDGVSQPTEPPAGWPTAGEARVGEARAGVRGDLSGNLGGVVVEGLAAHERLAGGHVDFDHRTRLDGFLAFKRGGLRRGARAASSRHGKAKEKEAKAETDWGHRYDGGGSGAGSGAGSGGRGGFSLQRLRTRKMGPYLILDVDLEIPPRMSASAAHIVAEHVRGGLLRADRRIAEVNLHLHPRGAPPLALLPALPPPLLPHEIEAEVRRAVMQLNAEKDAGPGVVSGHRFTGDGVEGDAGPFPEGSGAAAFLGHHEGSGSGLGEEEFRGLLSGARRVVRVAEVQVHYQSSGDDQSGDGQSLAEPAADERARPAAATTSGGRPTAKAHAKAHARGLAVKVDLVLRPELTLGEASAVARLVHRAVRCKLARKLAGSAVDVADVDVDLELDDWSPPPPTR
mmetsp:Transcript_23895/g.53916  ORF Transcript_23895/g.53916 Transcript_23895/m.53916 type:complete len:434 (+) Transcript_23895:1057-2358(+)